MIPVSANRQRLIAALLLGCAGVAIVAVMVSKRGVDESAPATAPREVAAAIAPKPAAQAPAPAPAVAPVEVDVPELRFLPKDVSLEDGAASQLIAGSSLARGNRRLTGIRSISSSSQNGPFTSPRLSPDGLQILVTRPGYDGLYVMGVNGGSPVKVAEGSAFRAEWMADGRISVRNADGSTSVYGSDGALESIKPAAQNQEVAYAQDDRIYVRPQGSDGQSHPLTGNDDQYFAPSVSPDGTQVVYTGLHSGVYVAPADGSGEPVYLGEGTNPQWLPDSSGVVYERTSDDGHDLTDGDIVLAENGFTEESILTPDDDAIYQRPSPGSDGSSVVFEDDDGSIYVGVIR